MKLSAQCHRATTNVQQRLRFVEIKWWFNGWKMKTVPTIESHVDVLNYISQGLRSWDQFRKNTSFREKKSKNIFYLVFGIFQTSQMHTEANPFWVFENGWQNSSHFRILNFFHADRSVCIHEGNTGTANFQYITF